MAFILAASATLLTPLVSGMHRSANDTIAQELHKPMGRYIFLAGLEGSGHHFFQTVFEKCIEAGSCGNRSREFYRWAWGASKRNDQVAMRRVWQLEDPRPESLGFPFVPRDDVVYPLNAIEVAGQMMSYPNFLPGNNPNMLQFAEAATYHGDSFKVVVLLRNPRDLLHSVQRRFNHTEADLVQSMVVMSKQLRKMPKGSYRCLRFEKFNDVGEVFSRYMDIPDFDIVGTMSELYSAEPGCNATAECPPAEVLIKEHRKFVKEVCGTQGDVAATGASLLGIPDVAPPAGFAEGTDVAEWLLSADR